MSFALHLCYSFRSGRAAHLALLPALLLAVMMLPVMGVSSASADGPVWQIETIPNLPANSVAGDVWTSGPNDTYVVTGSLVDTNIQQQILWHWNGLAWTTSLQLPGYNEAHIYGTGPDDLYAVANHSPGSGSDVWRSTDHGATWVQQALPTEVAKQQFYHITGLPNNIHVAGHDFDLYFNGQVWSALPIQTDLPSSLVVLSQNERYYAQCWGWGNWDGKNWQPHWQGWAFCDAGVGWAMRDASGLHYYVAGDNGWSNGVRIWRFDEASQSFQLMYSVGDAYQSGLVLGMWGAAPDNIYAVAQQGGYCAICVPMAPDLGRMYHFDGSNWVQLTGLPPFTRATGIFGSGPDNIWVSLVDGHLLRYGSPRGQPPTVTTITASPANPTNLTSASFSFSSKANSTFACSLDSAPLGPCISPQSYSGLVAGNHTFLVKATDAAGNTDPNGAGYNWTIDLAPPAANPSQSPAANAAGWNKSDTTVAWNWSDEGGSGIDLPHCTQNSTSSGDGTITLNATCQDLAGNTGHASYSVQVDQTAPAITINQPDNNATYSVGQTMPADYACSDTGSGIATCAGSAASGAAIDTNSAGAKSFTVTATDMAGNQVSKTISYRVVATISMGPQAMEGDLKVNPGASLTVGYDFTMPGSHPAADVTLAGAQVSFPYTCVTGSGAGSFQVTMPDATYSDPQNSSAWYPSGDQHSSLVYQGSLAVPDVCQGGQVRLQKGGVFTAGVLSTAPGYKVNLRWHYSANGSAGGWSGTGSIVPK